MSYFMFRHMRRSDNNNLISSSQDAILIHHLSHSVGLPQNVYLSMMMMKILKLLATMSILLTIDSRDQKL